MIEKNEPQAKSGRAELTLWVLIIGLSMAAALNYFFADERFFTWLSHHPCRWSSGNLGNSFRLLGKVWVPIWLLLFWALASKRYKPALVVLLALLMVLAFVFPLKVLIQRQRPRNDVKMLLLENQPVETEHELHYSFPSGDTATAFAVAAALSAFVTWHWTVLFFAVASGVGFLRLVDWAHYPSDVFAGAAIGVFCGWFALQIGQRWLSSVSPRPRLDAAICLLGLITIPVLIGLSNDGLYKLSIFLKTYALLAVSVYIIAAIVRRVKPPGDKKPCDH